jgi:hypothetical protein
MVRFARDFQRRAAWVLALAVGLSLLLAGAPASAQNKEASRIRVLVVADTGAPGAQIFGLGLDGDNVKRAFDEQLNRAGKSTRYTLELYTGGQVSPVNILNYYTNLKTNPTETLVFYYTGHGIMDQNQGHMITTHQGALPRKVLLAAMQKLNPQLVVLLTDCCANYAPGKQPIPGGLSDPGMTPVKFLTRQLPQPPSDDDRTRPKVNIAVKPVEPEPTQPSDLIGNLFFQHKGLVDINAAEIGKSASGKFNMGGSYFTIALCDELHKTIKEIDQNNDGFAEWREFFPGLDQATVAVSQKAFFFQRPQAFALGEAVK